jgi:hypothetical protein
MISKVLLIGGGKVFAKNYSIEGNRGTDPLFHCIM